MPAQSFPVDVFSGDKMCPVVFAYFMNREDVGMVQSRSGAGFLLKTIQAISVRRKLLAENFYRDFPAQLYVFSEIHLTHTARTELLQNPVV